MPYFDENIFTAADAVLDSIFADTDATFRANGVAIPITASVRSHAVGDDNDKTAAETWLGFVVECYWAELTINGQQVRPKGGEEFAFPMPSGTCQKVYSVVIGPKGRTYEPLDTIDNKVLVFVKYDHEEQI